MKRMLALAMALVAGGSIVAGDRVAAEVAPGVDALWELDVVPDVPNWPDADAVEVGVRFRSSEAVDILGVRFYKGDQNVGTHVGSLWQSDGTLLAQGTFANETVDGWQDLLFDAPVPVTPGATYIASYHAPSGYYAAMNHYYQLSMTVGPITALGGLEANGVYQYGPSTAFPTFSYLQTNYWVTPLWSTNSAPVVDAGADASGAEGAPIALSGSAADGDGDAVTTTWSVVSGPDDGGSCSFADASALSTTMTCDDDGVVEVRLEANDGTATGADTVVVTVANAAPTVDALIDTEEAVSVGSVVTLSTSVSDPGANDTASCTVEWGDGRSDTGPTCPASTTYSTAGVYDVTVTVTDDDGDVASDIAHVVVYDRSAGIVFGSGYVYSYPGAYQPDPSSQGWAWYGFISGYRQGANKPSGVTAFALFTECFVFYSTDYDWLVVTGSDYAKFKGTGTINGRGEYTFQIWAGDRSPDTFRIKIWKETASGDVVVYDNGSDQAVRYGYVEIWR